MTRQRRTSMWYRSATKPAPSSTEARAYRSADAEPFVGVMASVHVAEGAGWPGVVPADADARPRLTLDGRAPIGDAER